MLLILKHILKQSKFAFFVLNMFKLNYFILYISIFLNVDHNFVKKAFLCWTSNISSTYIYTNVYGNIKSTRSHVHTIFKNNLIHVFLFFYMVVQNKISGILSLYLALLVNAQHKNKNKNCSSSLWTCYMVILKRQNKITDFFMILARVWVFKHRDHVLGAANYWSWVTLVF